MRCSLGVGVCARFQVEYVLTLAVTAHEDHDAGGLAAFRLLAVNIPGRVVPEPQVAALDVVV